MTYVVKVRGQASFMAREFLCPVHGVFGELVAPDAEECPCPACFLPPEWRPPTLTGEEIASVPCYTCKAGAGEQCRDVVAGRHHFQRGFSALIQLAEMIPCGIPSSRVLSAPLGRVKLGEVTRGKVAKAPFPHALDTQPLADGMPLKEWKAKRRAMWADKRRAEQKAKMG